MGGDLKTFEHQKFSSKYFYGTSASVSHYLGVFSKLNSFPVLGDSAAGSWSWLEHLAFVPFALVIHCSAYEIQLLDAGS
jgi:hypothetical protein